MLPDAAQLSRPATDNCAIKLQVGSQTAPGSGRVFSLDRDIVSEQVPATQKSSHTAQGLRCRSEPDCAAGTDAVVGGGKCPLRRDPVERRRREAAITGRHGHRQGLLCIALASRSPCARTAAWGSMCARVQARTCGRKKRRETGSI